MQFELVSCTCVSFLSLVNTRVAWRGRRIQIHLACLAFFTVIVRQWGYRELNALLSFAVLR